MKETLPVIQMELPAQILLANATRCSAELKGELLANTRSSEPAQVVLDAQKVEEFDSSALSVLMQFKRDASAQNAEVQIVNLSPQLLELAGLYGVTELLTQA